MTELFNANDITVANFGGFMAIRKKNPTIYANRMSYSGGFKITDKEGQEIVGLNGDYLIIDENGDKSICPFSEFSKYYERM